MPTLTGWQWCPRCGGRLDVAGREATCPACGARYFAASEPTACAVCVDERGRVLLGRRASPPFEGAWDLPGGFVEDGEHPLDALRRELREETGLDAEPGAFLGMWMDVYADDADDPQATTTLNLYWLARLADGEPVAADDVVELRWFAPDELPPDEEIAFVNVADVLRAWREQEA